ncbi:hypothetical protein NECAME_12657 [Necator americanus]|uniref:Mos1 transposase HTH domain-containing protein n=1 Tax=Necator americanus TaxID=51031 RepID=W2SYX5_NECAM|nr:hypothetical protein NECAME_12657 [Necator americanus]ETN74890.1 hypothetical protein NECAME_12657 [Necator americanus]
MTTGRSNIDNCGRTNGCCLLPTLVLTSRARSRSCRDSSQCHIGFGSGAINEHTIQWWFSKFRSGKESPEDDKLSGRPSDVDNNQLRALVEANPRTTVRELAKELDATYTTISNHLQEIGKSKKLDKWNDLLTWVVAVIDSPKPLSQRFSLTLAALNVAKNRGTAGKINSRKSYLVAYGDIAQLFRD